MNSEFDYLNSYNLNDYERPSVTADIVVFTIRSKEPENFRKDPKNALSPVSYTHLTLPTNREV